MNVARLRRFTSDHAWIWSFLAAVLIWIVAYLEASRGFFGTLTAAAQVASFLVIVGIGQMFVITAGNGNIDLSVPGTMTVAGYFGVAAMNGHNSGLVAGLLIALLVGVVVATANLAAILVLRIPPIVATLAVGFIVQSVAFVKSNNFTANPSPALATFVNDKVAGIPVIALATVGLAVAAAVVLDRTVFGRSVQAIGQSLRAARLSDVRVNWTLAGAYLICGVFAALAGILLAADSGGVQLDIATPYLLNSIAVVVLGGSLIIGGKSNLPGIWGAALFLTLLVALLTLLNVSAAWQNVIKGILIIAVLSFASRAEET